MTRTSEKENILGRKKSRHRRRNRQAIRSRVHRTRKVPHMDSQRGIGQEKQWQVEDVHRLFGSEQSMPQRLLPITQYRPTH